jgi:S1-C subfamily serine protease
MASEQQDPLVQFSDALAARAAAARSFVAAIRTRHGLRSGILWGTDALVASEQVFPKATEAEVVLSDGRSIKAQVAGRDRGTNVVALRLEQPVEAKLPASAEPMLGALALAFGAAETGAPAPHLGIVRALGPAWHSLAGGLIDRRISLNFRISGREEGGPVVDAAGGLLGMSTAGPHGRALVIPASTIGRVLAPLLATGRVERGWLGVALHPVALPEVVIAETGQHRGLMVMQVAADGPAAKAGVHPGDILLRVGDTPASRPIEVGRSLGPDSVGRSIELHLIRAGAPVALSVTITARPAG